MHHSKKICNFTWVFLSSIIIISCGGREKLWDNANKYRKELVSIQAMPETISIPTGGEQVIRAIGTCADDTAIDVTSAVTWTIDGSGDEIVRIETGFDKNELKILNRVIRKYGSLNGEQLAELSHAEAPYTATEPYKEIPYEFTYYRGTDFSDL